MKKFIYIIIATLFLSITVPYTLLIYSVPEIDENFNETNTASSNTTEYQTEYTENFTITESPSESSYNKYYNYYYNIIFPLLHGKMMVYL